MNRARLGIVATIVVVIEAIIMGILSMLRTRYIIDGFGTNINAILQLAISLTSYLLLFESGMGVAFQYKMYKPLGKGELYNVGKLFNGLKVNMKKVAFKMLSVSIIISLGYSIVLQNKGVTYFEAVAILSVMFIRIIAPNIITLHYRTILFAMEKKYLSDIVECVKNSLIIIVELILIKNTNLPLVLILSLYVVFTFLSSFIYKTIIIKLGGKEILNQKEKNMEPVSMTGDILIHRIAGLITSNTDAVLLSVFSTLNNVTIYTSFFTLINYPITLITRIIDTMRATLAVKIIGSSRSESLDVFKMMVSFEMFCISMVIPIFILMGNECIGLWIGEQYTTTTINIIFLAAIGMHKMFIPIIYATRDATGLFKETKKISLLQAIINMVISLALVVPFGITGILFGTVIADFLVLQPFNIKVINRKVFLCGKDLYKTIFRTIILCFLLVIIGRKVLNIHFIKVLNGWEGFLIRTIILSIINFTLSIIGLLLYEQGFKILLIQFKKIFFLNKSKSNRL